MCVSGWLVLYGERSASSENEDNGGAESKLKGGIRHGGTTRLAGVAPNSSWEIAVPRVDLEIITQTASPFTARMSSKKSTV